MAAFVHNCRYAAAIATELDDGPIERQLLSEPVCLFKGEDGAPRGAMAENISTTQDLPVINRVRRNMKVDDLMSLNPVLLSVDSAAVRARRLLQGMIADEQAQLQRTAA